MKKNICLKTGDHVELKKYKVEGKERFSDNTFNIFLGIGIGLFLASCAWVIVIDSCNRDANCMVSPLLGFFISLLGVVVYMAAIGYILIKYQYKKDVYYEVKKVKKPYVWR